MARKRKQESGVEQLLNAPWWFSVGLAMATFILVSVVLPSLAGNSIVLKPLAAMAKGLGYFVAAAVGLIALVSYFRQRPSAPVTDLSRHRLEPIAAPDSAAGVTLRRDIDHAWGETPETLQGPVPPPATWSMELLRRIEWKRFEELVAAYFREKTFRTEAIRAGADGGVDVKLFVPGKDTPFAIVQCKAWNTYLVGVNPVRELLGVMAHQKVAKGIFVAMGNYTREAEAFAKENPLNLITGDMLFKGILALPEAGQMRLLAVATEGDYTTPTCASCGIKMVRRPGPRGGFWGCRNYPRCKQTFNTKTEADD